MRRPRGLTIIEVLIAIAIVLAMASLVVPNVAGRFERRAFESAMDQVGSQLLMARAHAQMTGMPVEVVFEPADDEAAMDRLPARIIARHLDLRDPVVIEALRQEAASDADASEPLFAALPMDDDLGGGRAGDNTDEDHESAIHEPWAVNVLPGGVRVQTQSPKALEAIASDGRLDAFLGEDATLAGEDEDTATASVRIAVFLPDGSLLAGRQVWLVDDDGRIARVDVNPWSGLADVRWIRTARDAQQEIDQQQERAEPADEEPDDVDDPTGSSEEDRTREGVEDGS